MGYLLIIVVAVIIIWWVERNTFHWEIVIKYLWKQIYQLADLMAGQIHAGINTILDFVNYLNKEKDENAEEETFGYGRFDFNHILNSARTERETFKRILK